MTHGAVVNLMRIGLNEAPLPSSSPGRGIVTFVTSAGAVKVMSIEPEAQDSGMFRCFTAVGQQELGVRREGGVLAVISSGSPILHLTTNKTVKGLHLRIAETAARDSQELIRATQAALEALFANDAHTGFALLDADHWSEVAEKLTRDGMAIAGEDGLQMYPELFWQLPNLWLTHDGAHAFPQHHVMTGGKRHPRRAPKPSGIVYSRYIPWLRRTFSFRTLDIDADLPRFNRWMNDPRVAYFWEEQGDLAKHRAYLGAIEADPHMMTLFGCLDGAPFCYFEIYWARENRLGPYYDVDDYDRGWHVVVGEDGYRGRDYVATWLPSLMHYLFLDDPRTQRIVGEPRADHAQQIRNLERSGFASIKEFDFPHKRAMLVSLLRERYFGERLWVPRGEQKAEPVAREERRAGLAATATTSGAPSGIA
jgi:acetyl CoA:N6-hydroxylysine acetyl transferase